MAYVYTKMFSRTININGTKVTFYTSKYIKKHYKDFVNKTLYGVGNTSERPFAVKFLNGNNIKFLSPTEAYDPSDPELNEQNNLYDFADNDTRYSNIPVLMNNKGDYKLVNPSELHF